MPFRILGIEFHNVHFDQVLDDFANRKSNYVCVRAVDSFYRKVPIP